MARRSYWAHITLNVNGDTPVETVAFFNAVMQLDLSRYFPNIRVLADGHLPATAIPTHQHQLLREMSVKQEGKRYRARAIFDFDIPHRLVPLVTPWLQRYIRSNFDWTEEEGRGTVTFDSSFYCIDYPQDEWLAICRRHGALDEDA